MKKRVAFGLFILCLVLIPMISFAQQGQPNQSGQPIAAEQPNQVVQPQQQAAPPPVAEPQKQPAPSKPLFLDQPQQEAQPAQQVPAQPVANEQPQQAIQPTQQVPPASVVEQQRQEPPQQPPAPVQQAEQQNLPAQPQQQQKPVIVGRISEVEGQLLRYVTDTSDWAATEKDNPAGVKDAFYSGESAKAEFIFPNNTVARIGGNTQFQLIKLDTDTIEADVASGTARFYNNGSAVIKCTTPIGYVLADTVSAFDITVGQSSAEINAVAGKIYFIHTGLGNSRYDVIAGSRSIIADAAQVTAGTGRSNADWVAWNSQLDNAWSNRLAKTTESSKYVPQGLQQESYALDESGKWENVNYEGQTRYLWRPTVVDASWSPFTNGRWVNYYGDQVWVPYESFGYVTHHYGNWVWVDASNGWYWAPPAVHYVEAGPYLPVEYAWYPGRVSWVYTDEYVGWVPLHYRDPYYSPYWDHYYHYYGAPYYGYHGHYHNYYGAHYTNVNININNLRYGNRAVVIGRNNLYRTFGGYRAARLNVNQQALHNFHTANHLNHTMVKGFGRERNQFSPKPVAFRPNQSVNSRVRQNQMAAHFKQNDNAQNYRNTIQHAKPGQLSTGQPKPVQAGNRMAPNNNMRKPAATANYANKDNHQPTQRQGGQGQQYQQHQASQKHPQQQQYQQHQSMQKQPQYQQNHNVQQHTQQQQYQQQQSTQKHSQQQPQYQQHQSVQRQPQQMQQQQRQQHQSVQKQPQQSQHQQHQAVQRQPQQQQQKSNGKDKKNK
jgi:hypothetical protein